MQLSNNLICAALDHYNKYCDKDFVVSPSLPILYFGDSGEYFSSDFKVITAALNPSDSEFIESNAAMPSFFRFPDYNYTCDSLQKALDNYFQIKPYKKWFGVPNKSASGFLPLLNGLGVSYYQSTYKNVALHTDICTPLATNPTWSGLKKEQKARLVNEGVQLWKELIIELQPDLILMSMKREMLDLLPVTFVRNIKTKKGKPRANRKQMEYTIEHYILKLKGFETNLIWGSAQNTPLQPFRNKQQLGKELLDYFHQKRNV